MARTRKNPDDELKKTIISNINYECNRQGWNKEDRELAFHFKQTTLNNKLNDPGKFTVEELIRFSKKANIYVGELFYPKISSRDAENAVAGAEKAVKNAEAYSEQFAKQFSEELAKQITYFINTLVSKVADE